MEIKREQNLIMILILETQKLLKMSLRIGKLLKYKRKKLEKIIIDNIVIFSMIHDQ